VRLLIVEDEPDLADALAAGLRAERIGAALAAQLGEDAA